MYAWEAVSDADQGTLVAYRTLLRTQGIELEGLRANEDGTLAPPTLPSDSLDADALPRYSTRSETAGVEQLELLHKVGEGGAGVVWAAEQRALGRRVAVKQLRDSRRATAGGQLLREALVTGRLEHPNIVPVHGLGRDDDGNPLIVLKFIEGERWREAFVPLFATPEPVDATELERQLGILVQVCNAVAFAHSRGVIHRDLKPDNVMIGTFGEVYVLDWGLAVSVQPQSGLRPASAIDAPEGTPPYMAPEMASSDGERIDCRTDVFLLGAILHELVTGRPPNHGETMGEVLASAYQCAPPSFEPWVPDELAQICRTAIAKDPTARFGTVLELRDAIAAFVRHRASRLLAADAAARLERLERSLDDLSEEQSVGATEAECRLAFDLALREWPDNPQAKAGLARLRDKARERHAEGRRNRRALEELRQAGDLGVIAAQRRRFAYIYGAIVALFGLGLYGLRKAGVFEAGYPTALGVVGVMLTTGVVIRRRLEPSINDANRRLMSVMLVAFLTAGGVFMLGWAAALPFVPTLGFVMVVAGTAAATLAVTVDRRVLPVGLCFYATAIPVVLWPEHRGIFVALGGFAAFAAGALAWREDT